MKIKNNACRTNFFPLTHSRVMLPKIFYDLHATRLIFECIFRMAQPIFDILAVPESLTAEENYKN